MGGFALYNSNPNYYYGYDPTSSGLSGVRTFGEPVATDDGRVDMERAEEEKRQRAKTSTKGHKRKTYHKQAKPEAHVSGPLSKLLGKQKK